MTAPTWQPTPQQLVEFEQWTNCLVTAGDVMPAEDTNAALLNLHKNIAWWLGAENKRLTRENRKLENLVAELNMVREGVDQRLVSPKRPTRTVRVRLHNTKGG
jgi:hypothetical protein